MAKLVVYPHKNSTGYLFYCPGCKEEHLYSVCTDGTRPTWAFNGDMEKPTFTPSLFMPDRVCHLFMTDGRIQYLSDCTHHLAGQTIDMVECRWPEDQDGPSTP